MPQAIAREKSEHWIAAGALFHKIEIAVVVGLLLVGTWGVVRAATDMTIFAMLWAIICVAAAAVALWPGTPRGLVIYAEALLLAVALGQWVGPRHDLFSLLGREIRGVEKWNQLELTQRRIIAWNVIVAVASFWLILPYAARQMRHPENRSIRSAAPAVAIFLIIWAALAFILVQAVRILLT